MGSDRARNPVRGPHWDDAPGLNVAQRFDPLRLAGGAVQRNPGCQPDLFAGSDCPRRSHGGRNTIARRWYSRLYGLIGPGQDEDRGPSERLRAVTRPSRNRRLVSLRPLPWLLALSVALAACGVDGPPVPPPADEDETPTRAGVQITGSGYAGVARQF